MARVKGFPEPAKLNRPERVTAALDEQFGDPQATAELIGLEAGIGPRRVKGILEDQGTTLRDELLNRRMGRARELLEKSDYAVRFVANMCGYRCQSTFAQRFAERHGESPREYRSRRGGKRRAGGPTGAFRKPAQRARARERGEPAPSMSPFRTLPGYNQARFAEWKNECRRARLRNESPPPMPPPSMSSEDRSDPYLDAYIDAYLDQFEEEWGFDE
jgi:AraC-like DNA-binding protein